MYNRVIKSVARSGTIQLTYCIGSLFAMELLHPSEEIYLISPWISDVPLLNNCQGQFRSIAPELSKGWIGLADLLLALSERGSLVYILCRPDQLQNENFLQKVSEFTSSKKTESLHEKGLVTNNFYLRGSMNFTYSGVNLNDESVELTTEPTAVSQAFIEAQQRWENLK
jgi:hypothetical protein